MTRLPGCMIFASFDPQHPWKSVSYDGPRQVGMGLAKTLRGSGFKASFRSIAIPGGHRCLGVETDAPLSDLQIRVLSFFADFTCMENITDGWWRVSDADGRVRYVPREEVC